MLQSGNRLILLNKTKGAQYLINVNLIGFSIRRFCHTKKENYAKYYQILEVPNNSDQEIVRRAFINLCKKYHPDSGQITANALKFQEIQSAYRSLQNKFAYERYNADEGIGEYGLYYKEKKNDATKPEVFDIKHTAPQHRQYLSHGGIGSGTPFQREKQYVKYRTIKAIENVYDHQVKKISQMNSSAKNTLMSKDKEQAKKIKTRYGMERLVEDLIQESMANGQFKNLKGEGKPLPPSNYNPYVDFVTHKMNEILIDNGFTPEWITLQKEIADDIDLIKKILSKERKKFGPLPLNLLEERKWEEVVSSLQPNVKKLNKKICKFNLVVPVLDKQKLYFDIEKVSCDILKTGLCSKEHMIVEEKKIEKHTTSTQQDSLSLLLSIFK